MSTAPDTDSPVPRQRAHGAYERARLTDPPDRLTVVNFELPHSRSSLSTRDAAGRQLLKFCSET